MKEVFVVFGEVGNISNNKEEIMLHPDKLDPISEMNVEAACIAATHNPEAQIIFVGCDPYQTGYDEATLMEKEAFSKSPDLLGRIQTLTGHLDTSYQAEAVSLELKRDEYKDVPVYLILPLGHKRRATGQVKAFGVKIEKVLEAHRVYVKETGISREERKRRIDEVKEIYFTRGMYLDLVKEFGLNVLGVIDRKGLLIRNISKRFRKNKRINPNSYIKEWNLEESIPLELTQDYANV
jgi:hypothetical protein